MNKPKVSLVRLIPLVVIGVGLIINAAVLPSLFAQCNTGAEEVYVAGWTTLRLSSSWTTWKI